MADIINRTTKRYAYATVEPAAANASTIRRRAIRQRDASRGCVRSATSADASTYPARPSRPERRMETTARHARPRDTTLPTSTLRSGASIVVGITKPTRASAFMVVMRRKRNATATETSHADYSFAGTRPN